MLQDWHIVILRPLHQAQGLFERVKLLQGEPILSPLCNIVPIPIDDVTLNVWCDLIRQADVIFISSANAVWYAPKKLLAAISRKSFIGTMGKATTQAFLDNGPEIGVDYTAAPGSTSEDVLAQTFFQAHHLSGKQIVLLAGTGGRTLLADEFQRKGAEVIWMKVYEQQQGVFDLSPQLMSWRSKQRLCFIAPSSRILTALIELTPLDDQAWLFTRPLIVVSERIHLQAKEWGFKHIFVAPNPHVEGIEYILQKMIFACDTLF